MPNSFACNAKKCLSAPLIYFKMRRYLSAVTCTRVTTGQGSYKVTEGDMRFTLLLFTFLPSPALSLSESLGKRM